MWGNQFQTVAPSERFWARVIEGGADDCWPWGGCVDERTGYGVFSVGRRNFGAHRFSYEDRVGPIPEGLTLDHDCHTRDKSCAGGATCPHRQCVNPTHLVPKSRGMNTLIGRTITAANVDKTHCPAEHEFTPENTYRYKGKRACRRCHTDRETARRRAERLAQGGLPEVSAS